MKQTLVVGKTILMVLVLVCSATCKSRDAYRSLPIPPSSEGGGTENDYVNDYLYSREMFPFERELVDRDLELRINYSLREAQKSGDVHVRAVSQPLQFTGDDAVDMSKTYTVLLVADDIPSGKTFLETYDVTIGPNPLAAVVRPAVSAKSLKTADLAYIQENITRLVLDEGALKADLAGAETTNKLLKKKIGDALAFANKEIGRATSIIDANRQAREDLRDELPGTLNQVDDAERAYKHAKKKHEQLEKQLKFAIGRDALSLVADMNIDSLLRQQSATDMTNADSIVSAADKAVDQENDATKKVALEEKLKSAQDAKNELVEAIGDYQLAVTKLEIARVAAERSSRDEAQKLVVEEEAKKAVTEATKLLAELETRKEQAEKAIEDPDAKIDDLKQTRDEKKETREANEKPLKAAKAALADRTTEMENAEKEKKKAEDALKTATDATRGDLQTKLETATASANTARTTHQEKKDLVDGLQDERDEISSEIEKLQQKIDKLAHFAQLDGMVEAKSGELVKLKKTIEKASAAAKTATEEHKKNATSMAERDTEVTEAKTKWNEKLVAMEKLGTPELRSEAATERLKTATSIAKKRREKQALTEDLPGLLGLGNTADIEEAFNVSQKELQAKKSELDSAGITLQRYNRDAYFKVARQRENIAAAEKSLESLKKKKLHLENLQGREDVINIALAVNQSLLKFWEGMMTERQSGTNDENREHAMRNAVMVQFRPQALKYLEKVQIDVLRIPVENSDYATGLVSGVRNTPDTNNGTGDSGSGNPDAKSAATSTTKVPPSSSSGADRDPFVRDEYCIRHQQSLFETARRNFEKAKKEDSEKQSDQTATEVEKKKEWDKLAAAEANMRSRYNDVQDAVSANELVTSLANAAIGSLDTLEGALGKMRTVLMMSGSRVGAQDRIDYLEHVTAEIPRALGAYHAAYAALVEPANRMVDPDLLDARSESDVREQLLLILQHVNKGDLVEGETATTNGLIDQVRSELATCQTELESLLTVVYAYNPEKSTTGALAKIRSGDLTVFRFNVLRGIVTTTAYLLADDNVCHLFGKSFAKHFYAAQVTLMNPNKKPIIIYGNTMKLIVRMNSVDQFDFAENGRPRRLSWWALYQPLDHDAITRMMYTMHEQDGRMIASHGLDFMSMVGAVGSAFTSSIDYNRAVAVFSGMFAPEAKKLLEKDLLRYQQNFSEIGLNDIEEIAAGTAITRFVFLPKGPIYGNFDYDADEANSLSTRSQDPSSKEFGTRALLPSYIHNIRREEVYIEGKRILASDPLSSGVR